MDRLRILVDPAREAGLSRSEALEVVSEADYYRSRALLRDWRPGHAVQTIWVTSEAMVTRYDDLLTDHRFEVARYSTRSQLSEALGVAVIPETIADAVIAKCDLVHVAQSQPLRDGESLEDWCLRVTLGPFWRAGPSVPGQLPGVLQSLCSRSPATDALQTLAAWRLRHLAAGRPEGAIWTWLAEEPFARARCLAACWAVQGYGEVGRQWVEQEQIGPEVVREAWQLVASLPADTRVADAVKSVALEAQMQHELAAQIKREGLLALRRSRACTRGEVLAAYRYACGRAADGHGLSAPEASTLASWAMQRSEDPVAQKLALVARLSSEVAMPEPLPQGANWQEVCAWLDGDSGYLAAYLSRAATGRLDETAPQVGAFEQWLCTSYHSLMTGTEVGLHWFGGSAAVANPDGVTILALLDGVPAPLGRYFRERLAGSGLVNIVSEGLRLSLLPTLTPTNRQCLISGRLPDQACNGGLADLCHLVGADGDEVRTLGKLDASVSADPGDVLFVHCRMVDENLLHKPMGNLDRWVQAHAALDGIAEGVCSFVRETKARNVPVLLGFVSDHGWTELPEGASVVAIPQELADQSTHRRVITGIADPSYGIPLPQHQYFLPADVTVASGYGCFGRRPHGAVHGGATPQETVVFGFWATTLPIAPMLDLGVCVAGVVRRAVRDNEVALKIANPNNEPVTVRRVALERISLSKSALPVQIEPSAVVELPVLCDASGATGPVGVSGSVSWSTGSGRARRQSVAMSVATTGAAETDSRFESMFDM